MTACPTLREWLTEEPYTLSLSAGFFGFFAHTGFLSVLEEQDLLPTHFCGASAGAMVAGIWACGMDTTEMKDRLMAVKRADFWDPGLGAGLLKGARFSAILDEMTGQKAFSDCRTSLAVSVYDVEARCSVARNSGPVSDAVRASCTVPGLFHPIRLEGKTYLDGGLGDRSGLLGAPETGRVLYHHLYSRSLIRRHSQKMTGIPDRDAMTTIAIAGLPGVGPFRLKNGALAMESARQALTEALDRPLPGADGGLVHLETTR